MTTSLLQPQAVQPGVIPFSSGPLRPRPSSLGALSWRASALGHAFDEVLLQGAPSELSQELSIVWSELHELLSALRGAGSLRPEAELQLQVAMVKAHEHARQGEQDLAAAAVAFVDTDAASRKASAVLQQGQRWLQQLQGFLVALQRELQRGRQALEEGLGHAEQDWQLMLKAAHAKLQQSLGAATAPHMGHPYLAKQQAAQAAAAPLHHHNEQPLLSLHQRFHQQQASAQLPQQQQHQQQQMDSQDNQDSSCSSSVCDSSCSASSALMMSVDGGSSGRSQPQHAQHAPHPRLVASRSRLGYSSHWALKVAL